MRPKISAKPNRSPPGALVAAYILFLVAGMAVFAEFFSPYSADFRDRNRLSSPPQVPRVDFRHGLFVYDWMAYRDPETLAMSFVEDRRAIVGLSFWVRTGEYRLLGLIPMHRRFFGTKAREGEGGTFFHFLGTDRYGRDVASRLVFGARVSLSLGAVSLGMMTLWGILIGGISGYVGGAVDHVIQRGMEIVSSVPQIPIWMALSVAIPDIWTPLQVYFAMTAALSLFGWSGLARAVRGRILSLKEEEYVTIARVSGASHLRIFFRHLLPALYGHLFAVQLATLPEMILGETTLSFLGLGLRDPVASWGVLLQDASHFQNIIRDPWLLAPLVPMTLVLVCVNVVSDGFWTGSGTSTCK